MAIKRLISEDQRKDVRDTAIVRAKKQVDLTDTDIRKLVVIMARKMGLLR